MRVYLAGPLFTPYEREFLSACAARLRDAGLEVFVPHEHGLAGPETRPEAIFAKDFAGLEAANAVLALLDGPAVDDGTACEIGLFHALALAEPRTRKGVVGLLTDMRAARGADRRLNLFVHGCVAATGGVHASLDDALAVLLRWRGELAEAGDTRQHAR